MTFLSIFVHIIYAQTCRYRRFDFFMQIKLGLKHSQKLLLFHLFLYALPLICCHIRVNERKKQCVCVGKMYSKNADLIMLLHLVPKRNINKTKQIYSITIDILLLHLLYTYTIHMYKKNMLYHIQFSYPNCRVVRIEADR